MRDWLACHCAVRFGRFNRFRLLALLRRRLLSVVSREEGIRASSPFNFELFLPSWDPGLLGSLLKGRIFEPLLARLLFRLIRPGDIVIDGGAHVGFYTIVAARALGGTGKVVAFEPDHRNFALLQHNIVLNGCRDVVVAEQKALTNQTGDSVLWTSDEVSTRASLIPDENQREASHHVAGVSLDDYVARSGISNLSLIKLDLEGGEVAALEGMRSTIRTADYLIFELNEARLRATPFDPLALVRAFQEAGNFSCAAILDEEGGVLVPLDRPSIIGLLAASGGYVNVFLSRKPFVISAEALLSFDS
jgi:FkbM family methyltransferase